MKTFTMLTVVATALAAANAAAPGATAINQLGNFMKPENLHRMLADETTVELTPQLITELYQASFLGRCFSAYPGISDYILCEFDRQVSATVDISASAESDSDFSENAASSGLGLEFMLNITVDYDVEDMDPDTCSDAFVGKEELVCAFLIESDDLKKFIEDAKNDFAGVSQCEDLANLYAIYKDDGEEALNDAAAVQCTEDSVGITPSSRRALQNTESDDSLEDSTGALEDSNIDDVIDEFNAIANRCDEVAPNTVSRPPSPASLTFPSLVTVATALVLSAFFN